MEKPKGTVGIWIGVLLIIGGIVLGIVLVVVGARSLVDGFTGLQRVPIRTGGTVQIDDLGTQTLYAERPTSETGTSFNTTTFSGYGPDITVRVTGPSGEDVSVTAMSSSETYVYQGHAGVRIGQFVADTPGTYTIRPQGADGAGLYTTVAVGSGLQFDGLGAILGGVFGGGFVVLIGVILVIVFAVRRSRSKKRIAMAGAPYGAYGAAPGAGWAAAPAYPAPSPYGSPPPPGVPGAPAAGGWAAPPVVAPGWVPPPAPPAPAPPAPASGQPWQPPAPPPGPSAPWTPPPAAPPPPWGAPAPAAPPSDAPEDDQTMPPAEDHPGS